jgi:putative flippase GtrA
MNRMFRFDSTRARLLEAWQSRGLSVKAISFGLIGVVNTTVDYCVFLLTRAALGRSQAGLSAIGSFADFCHCGSVEALTLIAANLAAWLVAVTGSYVMNSSITFAAESGRTLRWRAYAAFFASGVVGWLTNTITLLIAAEMFLLPVWLAKVVAILASFVVNFSLSHFVVFRVRGGPTKDAQNDV